MVTKVLFSSNVPSASAGAELWVTDGTAAGTSLVRDIQPGLRGSYPGNITPFGNGALFFAYDTSHGRDLWFTDGTSGGTQFVAAARAGTTDPKVLGMAAVGARAVFFANDGTHGTELWVTDGTGGGTSLLKDIKAGGTTSSSVARDSYTPRSPYFTVVNSKAFFKADDGTNGQELWVTDGTAGGTSMVANLGNGSTSGAPKSITAFNGGVIFGSLGSTLAREVWFSDGTSAGTTLVKDIATGPYSSSPHNFAVMGSKALFSAYDRSLHSYEPFVTDGTAAGTTRLASPNGGFSRAFTVMDNTKALFWTEPGSLAHRTLWVTDGTAAGTSQINNALVPAPGTYKQSMGLVGGKAIFGARADATSPTTLWVTDGTGAGTSQINTNATLGTYIYFTPINNKLLFADTTKQLWVTDGTSAGTSILGNLKDNLPYYYGPIAAVSIACFAEGTRIATERGDVAVEALRAGDPVLTAGGVSRPIRWIGHRRIEPARHPRPGDVTPIRVLAGAFGEGAPGRDLYLSPDHAVFADGVLVPVRYLVNGRTIAPVSSAAVTYFHVELDGGDGMAVHDVLLAEGLACESYLDTGNRGAFEGGPALALHADFARAVWDARGCAPLRIEGAEVVALRSWLLARAEALGHRRVDDPGLVLEADGRRVFARVTAEGLRVDLPPGIGSLRLRSRVMVPAEVLDDGADTRRLGVALVGLTLDGVAIGLDSPRLEAGWHAVEAGRRWTDGDARIAVLGARRVVLRVEAAPVYWEDEESFFFEKKNQKTFSHLG